MPRIKICTEPGCNNTQTTKGYCRLHYLKNWKKIKAEKHKKAADRLNKFIENIVAKNPDRYVEVLKKEIRSKGLDKAAKEEYSSELEDIYKIFNDPGYEADIEKLIQGLKVEDEF